MLKTPYLQALALVAGSLTIPAFGQISLTPGNLTYSQDFDSLLTTTTAENWTDNAGTTSANDAPKLVGLPGWYAASFLSASATEVNPGYTPLIRGGTGSSATGSFFSFGSTGSSDRALGTLPSDAITAAGAGALRLGVRFVNDTASYLDGFSFSYDGEEWRIGSASAINNQFSVRYAVFSPGTGNLTTDPYTTLPAAFFNTPNDGNGTAAALDGNAPENRIAGLGDTVTGLAIAPGDELWLCWSDANSSGADHGMGIDNFTITFTVPEPATGALLGLGILLLAKRVRRQN